MKKPIDIVEEEEQNVEHREAEADAIDALNEDVPINPMPKENLPHIKKMEVEDEPKNKGDGVEKALEQLDDYYKDTPKRNPHFDHGGED